jgi:hypothetical protein
LARPRHRSPDVAWTLRLIEDEKAKLRDSLAEFNKPDTSPAARLDFLSERIRDLDSDDTALGQLQRFITIIAVFLHHERFGGLTDRVIGGLTRVAEAILKTQGIQEKSSRLAFLHGELHLALSQVYRKDGKHWLAAWEQQLGYYSAKIDPAGGLAFQALAMGNRMIRLGNGPTALRLFTLAETSEPKPSVFERARINRILTLRLLTRCDEAANLASDSLKITTLHPEIRKEVIWENAVRTALQSGSLAPVCSLVSQGSTHHDASYLIEAGLYAKVFAQRAWMERLPKMKYLARKPNMHPQRLGYIFRCAAQLDDCYDYEIPIAVRLRKLGEILKNTNRLISVTGELLVLAAAARWLNRAHASDLATLVYDEYRALSMRLTGGQKDDSLGIISDIDHHLKSPETTNKN